MLRYVYNQDEVVGRFVAQLIPHCRHGFTQFTSIGVINEGGQLIAGLVYHNYDEDAKIVELSGAAIHPRWLTRGSIARMYQYPFLQLGVQMLVQRTPASDERLLGQLAAYDFTFIKVPRMYGRDRDGVLCCLTFEDWCANRFNKRFGHHTYSVFAPTEEKAA